MNQLAMEIIGTQNHQIQTMRSVLDAEKYVPEDDCKVEFISDHSMIDKDSSEDKDPSDSSNMKDPSDGTKAAPEIMALLGVFFSILAL